MKNKTSCRWMILGVLAQVFISIPSQAARVFDVVASTVSEFDVALQPGRQNIIQAAHDNVVLYLLDQKGSQVASNIDGDVLPGSPGRALLFTPRLGQYRLVAWKAGESASPKNTDVIVNGRVVRQRIAVGGRYIPVADGFPDLRIIGPQVVEIGQMVGGATRPVVYAVDCDGAIIAKDLTSGVGNVPRLTLPVTSCGVLVGSLSPATGGYLRLYINDIVIDQDNDGLGRGLEVELGTCDSDTSHGYCSTVFNHQDSDHDGLSDYHELLGIDDRISPQLLSRWGADPLHKDLFIEVDYKYKSRQSQIDKGAYFTPEAAASAQERFDLGLADDLRNPDGRDGIALHFDSGFSGSRESTLYGDWGGSNEVPISIVDANGNADPVQYDEAARTAEWFNPVRRNVFRYALMGVGENAGDGQANRISLGWSATESNPRTNTFVHELGHTLALTHHGAPHTLETNCNPFYRSMMNYLYYPRLYPFFSQGANARVSADSLDETLPTSIDELMTGDAFKFPLHNGGTVDWNRDGIVSGPGAGTDPVRYPITLAGNCGSIVKNEQQLKDLGTEFENDDTPSLAFDPRSNRLIAAWIEDGVINFRSAKSRDNTANGSCTIDQVFGDHDCFNWSQQQKIITSRKVQHVDVRFWNGELIVALITDQNQLMAGSYKPDADRLLELRTPVAVSGMPSTLAPEITVLPSANGPSMLSILVSDIRSGTLRVASWQPSTAAWKVRKTVTRSGDQLPAATSPTAANWANQENFSRAESVEGTCISTTYPTHRVALYCFNSANGTWSDVSTSAFSQYGSNWPKSDTKTGFVFYRPRSTNGGPVKPINWLRGEFWLITTEQGDLRWQSKLHRTQSVRLNQQNIETIRFQRDIDRNFGGTWTSVEPGTGISLVEHQKLGAIKALWLRSTKAGAQPDPDLGLPVVFDKEVELLPFADGTLPGLLRDVNDFRIMESYMCLVLMKGQEDNRARGEDYCGAWQQSYWGSYLED